jgi:hypothetical protein
MVFLSLHAHDCFTLMPADFVSTLTDASKDESLDSPDAVHELHSLPSPGWHDKDSVKLVALLTRPKVALPASVRKS